MSAYDAIVVGAGPNGLTTAALLAKAGRKVLVLERRDVIGGAAASEEFHTGYRTVGLLHDTSGVRPGVVDALSLAGYGLELSPDPKSIFVPDPKSGGLFLHHDPEQAAPEIEPFSERDIAAYKGYREFLGEIREVVGRVMDRPPPNLSDLGGKDKLSLLWTGWMLRRLGRKKMMEVMRIGTMCVADSLNERFETDLLKVALAGPAIFPSFTGPWSPGTALNLLLWESACRGSVVGGPRALIASLERAATASGATIRTGAEVQQILIREGGVRGVRLGGGEEIDCTVVATSCDPRRTFLELIDSREIPFRLEHRIRHFRGRGTTAKVNLALDGPLEFAGRSGEFFQFVRTATDLDAMEKSFDPVKYDELPENPSLDICVPTVESPDLAPDGHSVVSILAHFVPYRLKEGWTDATRKELGDTVIRTLSTYAPTLPSQIVGKEVLVPPDLEERYGLVEGHLYHGDHASDQLVLRPTPECANYRTPVNGLFLCGSGSHPGGGITCAPGALAARTILEQ